MKLGAMLEDVLRSMFLRPATSRYPFERRPVSAQLRGHLRWNPEQCTGCGLCTKDCPANALELITIDKASKRYVIRYDVGRCTFCGQCVESCRFKCLELAHDQWELAALNKDNFVTYYGNKNDVQLVRESAANAEAVTAV